MSQISQYAVLVLGGVILFGMVLGWMQWTLRKRARSVTGAVRSLEGKAARVVDKGEPVEREEEEGASRAALYGIPYLAWILTSILLLSSFFVLFYENLAKPYPLPTPGDRSFIAYRAPAAFEFGAREFRRHELLIPRGEVVSASELALVEKALDVRSRVPGGLVLGSVVLLGMYFFILLYHMNILYPSSTEKNRNLVLIYLVVLVVLATAKIAFFYDFFTLFLVPIPWAGMTITILVNRRVVPLTVLVMVIGVSLLSEPDLRLFLVLLAGGLVSGTWVRWARKRSEVMMASLLVGLVMLTTYACITLLRGGVIEPLRQELIASFMIGPLSGLLVLLTLPLLEYVFDLTSPFRLLELLDLNTPVLRELFLKAPGTYQHSMAVANMAEMVAREVGANDLLVRVGSYYHDIGKMFSPAYFVENQAEGENPHDDLGLVASAAVIRSHVILGEKLAQTIRLPGPVIDFIREHHGTSTIDYFFMKSREVSSGIMSEKVFKYPGPKPSSRETGIVMIVDSVEAASRLLKSRDEGQIRDLISKIVRRKFEQAQLVNSGLTTGDLEKMIAILIQILKSSGHQRISYPGQVEAPKSPAVNGVRDKDRRSEATR